MELGGVGGSLRAAVVPTRKEKPQQSFIFFVSHVVFQFHSNPEARFLLKLLMRARQAAFSGVSASARSCVWIM